MDLTGLFLGAGASYDTGMPLASELTAELKDWLTPAKLNWLNEVWQAQGGGYSEATICDLNGVLAKESMDYEHIVGYLEVQSERIRERSEEYHGLLAFLSEIIYHLLKERHVQNESFIARNIRYLQGINEFGKSNKPLWVFSLNHDLVVECFCADYDIPARFGYGDEIVRLPRRDKEGATSGEVEARAIRRDQIANHTLNFFRPGEEGINLLKIHGSLDEFAFNDGQDLLKIVPSDHSAAGVIAALRNVNAEVRYIDPRWPGGVVTARNEIVYADAEGEMQFLRRTPLAGAFKFQGRSEQSVPNELLSYFTFSLKYLSALVCIGYGFGDPHVNQAIRNWLEGDYARRLTIVNPGVEQVATQLQHLCPQIAMVKLRATEYLDGNAGILRTRRENLERGFAAVVRNMNREDVQNLIEEFLGRLANGVAASTLDWFKTLPWRDGSIDLDALGLSVEEFIKTAREAVPMLTLDEALEEFLIQATDPN